MQLVITYTADDALVTQALTMFTAAHGYHPTIVDSDGNTVPNPVTMLEFARLKIRQFVSDSIGAYATSQGYAQTQAAVAAQLANMANNSSLTITTV